ncbi:MAG: hypothetical protein QM778_33245 [Myxococcales bacterium]
MSAAKDLRILDSIEVSRAGKDALPFVLDSWAESFRRANRGMPTSAFHAWHRSLRERILSRHPMVLVARDREDPAFLYGWLCAEAREAFTLHYAYTKASFQGQGVAGLLLDTAQNVGSQIFVLEGREPERFYSHQGKWTRYLQSRGFTYRAAR